MSSMASETVSSPEDRVRLVSDILDEADGRLCVGGSWRKAESERSLVTLNPSTGEPLGRFGVAGPSDVNAAVEAAQEAEADWARLSWSERSGYLRGLYECVRDNVDLLAACDSVDAGLPISAMGPEVRAAAESIQRWPGYAAAATGDVHERGDGRLHYTTSGPYGVVARIIAYNHPSHAALVGMLPVLLAGNTLILKPADQTPASALAVAKITQQALPPGVLNVVTGDAGTGEALVSHPQIRRIAFTGSTATGLAVQRAAARDHVRTVTLELSGKNPMIVFDDADIDAVCDGVISGMNLRVNQGQSCGSTSRVYVHRSLYDQLLEGVAERMKALQVGPAYEDGTTFGPLISSEHADSVKGHIRRAIAQGARLVTGGPDAAGIPHRGFFVAPTLIADTRSEMDIRREEVFGPVVAVSATNDAKGLIAEANRSDYGLSASIWTRDIDRALGAVSGVEAGYVWVNCAAEYPWGMPFGGWKDSGIGSQGCLEELASYRQSKTVHVNLRKVEL